MIDSAGIAQLVLIGLATVSPLLLLVTACGMIWGLRKLI